MRRVWEEIGFVPSSFELPPSDDHDMVNDKPVATVEKFTRANTNNLVTTEKDTERYIGLSIANFSLDVGDEEIKNFLIEKVGEEAKDKVTIIREKKKAAATISNSLTAEKVKEAMAKLNFNDCKLKFFGLPLYCRPLRDITPDKPSAVIPIPDSQSSPIVTPTGTIQKKIPGLPSSAQAKAISRKNSREKKERKEKEKKLKEEELKKKQRTAKNSSAFDVLMNAQKVQYLEIDPRDQLIPDNCSPAPLRSEFGKQIFSENRRMSLGSSPKLSLRFPKRGAEELSSPTSPPPVNELKKNKPGSENQGQLATPTK